MKFFAVLFWLSIMATMVTAFSTSFYVNMAAVQNDKVRTIRHQYRKTKRNHNRRAGRGRKVGSKMTAKFLQMLNLKMRQM